MKNAFFILLSLFFVNSTLVAQTLLDELKKDYTNQGQLPSSYVIGRESVTLKTGFSASAAAGQSFRLRVVAKDEHYQGQYDNTKNYIVTKMFRKEMTSSASASKISDVTEQIQYFDGLGRPEQVVIRHASPEGHDLVQHIEYDDLGRQQKQYLPYVQNFNLGEFITDPVPKIDAFYLQGGNLATTNTYYQESVFDNSPLNRVLEQSAPGDVWKIGTTLDAEGRSNGKTTKSVLRTNTLNEVRLWSISTSNLPVSSAYYGINQLMVSIIKDENWVSGDGDLNTVAEFKDKLGRVVLKQAYVTDNTVQKLSTYYVYDDYGNLRFVIPPKASKLGSLSTTTVAELCFSYTYDDRNRMVSKTVPGAQVVYMVYDQWDRLVLTQDGNQRVNEDWLFTKYDVLNRPIVTGKVKISGSTSAAQLESLRTTVQNATRSYETLASGSDTYSSTGSYPTTSSNKTLNTVTYYDNYNFLQAADWDATYDFDNTHGGISFTKATGVKGQVTGAKIRILNDPSPVGGNDRMLKSVSYYDNKYRVIQGVSENHLGGVGKTSNVYDFTGNILETYQDHTSSVDQIAIKNEMNYDHTGRLLTVTETVSSDAPVITVANNYNELGELIEKNLHSTNNGSSYLQSVDYRYNIRGWLTSINNSKLTNSGTNNDSNDLFGMELQYNTAVTVNGHSIAPQYNGNITSIKWNTDNMEEAKKEQIYGYAYDELNRITNAYSASANGANWTSDPGNFDMNIGNGTASGYDENGNILNLTRYGLIDNVKTKIDDLSYAYENSGVSNQLKQVDDAVTSQIQGIGFNENMPGVANDYIYDENGNMKIDHNKGLDITYNYLNLPHTVAVATKGEIEYVYTVSGSKLAQIVKATNGTTVEKRTDYIGAMQYETGKTEPIKLSAIMNGEGRILKNEDGSYQQEYFLKDHLGNTRVTFGYLKDSEAYLATLENDSYTTEKTQFLNLETGRYNASNHTKATEDEPYPTYGKQVDVGQTGPAMVLPVLSGDKVSMEAWVSYTGTASNNVNGMVSALSTVFSGSLVIPGSETVASVTANFESLATSAIANTSNSSEVSLNYIFIPTVGTSSFGVTTLSTGDATGYYKKLEFANKLVVPANGTLYIYTMNESAGATTYFDDVLIIHEKNTSSLQVTQSADYYPFGLTFNSFKREDSKVNDFLYNGKEMQDELDVNWMDYGARMYDAAIGRFMVKDRFAHKYYPLSPYSYTANNPINMIDINGDSIAVKGYNYVLDDKGNSSLVNKNGEVYNKRYKNGKKAGQLKGYRGKVKRGLDKVKNGGADGNNLVTELVNNSQTVDIVRDDNSFSAKGLSRTLSWNPSDGDGGLDVNGNTARPSFIGLSHELGHAYDAIVRKEYNLKEWVSGSGVAVAEKYASHVENMIRSENGIALRANYSNTSNPSYNLLNGDNTSAHFKRMYETSIEPQKFSDYQSSAYEY